MQRFRMWKESPVSAPPTGRGTRGSCR
ncbi:uncharacterized, partial [Tachysurus ichikawai]